MTKPPLRLAYRPLALFLALTVTIGLAGCPTLPTQAPLTFNGSVLVAEGTATLLGKTCLGLSQRERIPVDTLVRCTSTVEQAGSMIDLARSAGAEAGQDRLAAAQALLATLEKELKAREAKQ